MNRLCDVGGCESVHFGKGFCIKHYKRWYRHGHTDLFHVRPTCSVEDCGNPHSGKGLCRKHLERLNRHGDPSVVLKPGLAPRSAFDRCQGKYEVRGPDECWPWTRGLIRGYGSVAENGHNLKAHRVIYEALVGPIPEGLQLDHQCHNEDLSCPGGETCPHRRCVNPSHLEPATNRENGLRGRSVAAINARKTRCIRGHEFTPENTITKIQRGRPTRECRTCENDMQRLRRYERLTSSTKVAPQSRAS